MKSIIIVSAGIMQIPAIKKAKELGLNVICTDKNPNAVGFEYCDLSMPIDSKDIKGHIDYVDKHKDIYNIKGAFVGSDVATTVAAINSVLSVKAISLEVAERSNNKWLMKQCWLRDNVSTPNSIHVTNIDEAIKAANEIGLPYMVKSVDNAASRGCKLIESSVDLEKAFENACKHSRTNTALIEEYVSGKEYSVESIIVKGVVNIISIAERHFDFLPYNIEIAHIDPVNLSDEQYNAIRDLVSSAAKSLGIDHGPAKSDIITDSSGFKILEMPARLSGGFHSQYTTPISSGMEPIKAVMQLAIDEEINSNYIKPQRKRYSMCAGIFPKPGKLISIEGLQNAQNSDGVKEIICTKKLGDFITEYRDNGDRFFWVITEGETRDAAIRNFELAKAKIKFIVETKK